MATEAGEGVLLLTASGVGCYPDQRHQLAKLDGPAVVSDRMPALAVTPPAYGPHVGQGSRLGGRSIDSGGQAL